jgi:hypothetical protein
VYALTCIGFDLDTAIFDAGVAISSMRAPAVHRPDRVDTVTKAPIFLA